jgi:hypothetical protein
LVEAIVYDEDHDTGLIHSVKTTATKVHVLNPMADLKYGESTMAYADAT